MLNQRRSFLQSAIFLLAGLKSAASWNLHTESPAIESGFNMCGYAAPAIPNIRVGIIGIGNRGQAAIKRLRYLEGVSIMALSDLRPERLEAANALLPKTAIGYSKGYDAWKQLCERSDLDLIYICTPWNLHAQMAVYSMEQNKHVCVEVPAATTLDECWQLVHTSEKHRRHCMMLENVCYGPSQLTALQMMHAGLFGDSVHAEGKYIHDLLEANFTKDRYWNYWKLKASLNNGNLYPTHAFGPVAQLMGLNRGDYPVSLVSMSSEDFSMKQKAKALSATDPDLAHYANKTFHGNINHSLIKTAKGRTILLQYDESSPRPRSTLHFLGGTNGAVETNNDKLQVSLGKEWISEDDLAKLKVEHQTAWVKKIGKEAARTGGHGGMDMIMDWRNIDCLRNGLPVDQNVYDAALWSAITPLTQASLAAGSNSISIPDFTAGRWKTNLPIDLSLSKGGNTQIKSYS